MTDSAAGARGGSGGGTRTQRAWLSPLAETLVCGGVSGCAGKSATAPLSRLTILYQVHSLVTTKPNQPSYAPSVREALTKTLRREGWAALWKGNMCTCLHRFPCVLRSLLLRRRRCRYALRVLGLLLLLARLTVRLPLSLERYTAINFAAYDEARAHPLFFRDARGEPTPANRFAAGALAAAAATTACYPLDLVRARLMTQFVGRELCVLLRCRRPYAGTATLLLLLLLRRYRSRATPRPREPRPLLPRRQLTPPHP